MAIFHNQATLFYNGTGIVSNVTVGEILNALTVTKTAVVPSYSQGSSVTYVVSIVNSGTVDCTGLTLTDNLGTYTLGMLTLTPLTYVTGSVQYFVNGVLQPQPTVTDENPLTITGIEVPAGGNAAIVYETTANAFAPPTAGSSIVNTVMVTGCCFAAPVTAEETIYVSTDAELSISKSLAPTSVVENGEITYTFVLQNSGNTATAAGSVTLTDVFDPALAGITVTLAGSPLVEGVGYTYNPVTGLFTVPAGQITVPAATYTQNPVTGVWTITPGSITLTVTGTI